MRRSERGKRRKETGTRCSSDTTCVYVPLLIYLLIRKEREREQKKPTPRFFHEEVSNKKTAVKKRSGGNGLCRIERKGEGMLLLSSPPPPLLRCCAFIYICIQKNPDFYDDHIYVLSMRLAVVRFTYCLYTWQKTLSSPADPAMCIHRTNCASSIMNCQGSRKEPRAVGGEKKKGGERISSHTSLHFHRRGS